MREEVRERASIAFRSVSVGVFEMVVIIALISTTGSVVRTWMRRSSKDRALSDDRLRALEADPTKRGSRRRKSRRKKGSPSSTIN
jgi:hypothetical protein